MRSIRIWIDTDVGDNPDDAVALLLAGAHPSVELVGVSVVGDDPTRRVDIARSLLGHGFAGPIVHGGDVAGAMDEAVPEAVVAIGPLTNLARATIDVPVTIMGGALRAVHHRGAVRLVESNFAADPAAARAALRTHFCRLVPLDVTRRMVLAPDQVDHLRRVHAELATQLDGWTDVVCLHDPLALLVAVDDAEYDDDVERVTVDRRGRVIRGRGIEQRIVLDADTDAALSRVLEVLGVV